MMIFIRRGAWRNSRTTEQREFLSGNNFNFEELALQRARAVEADDLVAARAADELRFITRNVAEATLPLPAEFDSARNYCAAADEFAFTFDEHFDDFANHLAIIFGGDFRLNREELIVSRSLHTIRHIIFKTIDRNRAGPRGIFENKTVFKFADFHHFNCLREIFVGLGWKSDDEIAGDADVGHQFSGAIDQLEILLRRVSAIHHFEETIAAALRGDVQISTDSRAIAHGLQCLIREISREAGNESQSRKIRRRFVEQIKKIGESCLPTVAVIVIVMVDRLTEQRDFLRAGVGEHANFIDDILRRAMHLGATRVGDDAIRAEFIAAAGDADIGLRDFVGGGNRAREVEHFEMIFGGGEGCAAARGSAHQCDLTIGAEAHG